METEVTAQNEIIRSACAEGERWVKVSDLWMDEKVRKACGDKASLLDLVFRMYLRGLLTAGLLDGHVLVVWASGSAPRSEDGVTFRA
jgi:hypothetical protein